MRKSIFILAISLLLPIFCCAQENNSTERKSDVERYKTLAEQGDADAQDKLAESYYFGLGVDIDYEQAVFWYTKAAEQGHALAQYFLGECYYNGEGVEKDMKQAAYWLKKAAEQGVEDAKVTLEKIKD